MPRLSLSRSSPQLEVRRLAHRNAEAKGDASEDVWLELLSAHLPHRYRVAKGIIIDADGRESHYIDIIVYDRHFTPLVFNRDGKVYIPAEGVYAVIEAKQELTRATSFMQGGRPRAFAGCDAPHDGSSTRAAKHRRGDRRLHELLY